MIAEKVKILLWLIPFAYLAGSANFSILLFKCMGKADPRSRFSGNPGTANVVRQSGYMWGSFILILDIGRAALIVLLADELLKDAFSLWVGFALLVGNRYPVFHGFKGGKGVATYLGITAVMAPFFAAASCLTWVLVYAVVRITFIGSFFMVAVMGFGMMRYFHWNAVAVTGSLLSLALIFHAHRSNIANYQAIREKDPHAGKA
ncbi:MAG: glycerol-3-phosphate acyltransferase [Deltaproteobacteria bacterium]|nr:glycerol-3-phosphate acyltransferase [Deltaproteobacteria bacterium]